jgi:hypothetical protein
MGVRFFLAVLFLWSCFRVSLSGQTAEVLLEDKALFKVQNQIYFFSEVVTILKGIEAYRCFNPDSALLKAVKLDKISLPQIPPLTFNKVLDQQEMVILGRVVDLIKIKDFALSEGLSTTDAQVSPSAPLVAEGLKNGCQLGEVLSLSSLELYLRGERPFAERVQASSFWVSEKELKGVLQRGPEIPVKVAQEAIKEKKMRETEAFFVGSLLRQVSHEILWPGGPP